MILTMYECTINEGRLGKPEIDKGTFMGTQEYSRNILGF